MVLLFVSHLQELGLTFYLSVRSVAVATCDLSPAVAYFDPAGAMKKVSANQTSRIL